MYSKYNIKHIYTNILNNINVNTQLYESDIITKNICKSNFLKDYNNIGIFYRYKNEPNIVRIIQKYKHCKNFFTDTSSKLDILFIHGLTYDNDNYIITKNRFDKIKHETVLKVGVFYTEQKLNDGLISLYNLRNHDDVVKVDCILTSKMLPKSLRKFADAHK